jgi:hypothetical protein
VHVCPGAGLGRSALLGMICLVEAHEHGGCIDGKCSQLPFAYSSAVVAKLAIKATDPGGTFESRHCVNRRVPRTAAELAAITSPLAAPRASACPSFSVGITR